jgi:hypothetical protein
MEYLKYFDFNLNYHPGKANVVADALSRKTLYASELLMHQCGLYQKLRDLNLNVVYRKSGVRINRMELSCELRPRVVQAQQDDVELQKRIVTARIFNKENNKKNFIYLKSVTIYIFFLKNITV